MSKKTILVLLAISLFGACLRFWQLGNVPPSPDWDEAALGYNAYSIMKTGRDEYGELFPIILRSFDDYKPALYAYLAIPFIKTLGLNIFAVRLPSVIFGILSVIATYFLIYELFKKRSLALTASFLLAISPWHLQFSRIAFESNVGLALNIFAILFFLKGLKKPLLMVFSVLFFGLSLHVYQSEKVFVPIIALVLLTLFRREIMALPKKYLVLSFLTVVLLVTPIILYITTNQQALLRARGVSFFADQTPFLARTADRLNQDTKMGDILGLVLDNRRITYLIGVTSGYISHFDINWLFISGDQVRHHAPDMGLLYLWELPFLLVGIYSLLFGKFEKKTKIVIFFWFLIAPIPASITSGVPHSIRTLNFLPTWQIFTAVGIIVVIASISKIKYEIAKIHIKYLIFALCFLFLLFNFSYYLNQYFVQQNYRNSSDWQYGYKQAISEIKKIEYRYENIIVTNKPHLDQSYIFFLFYTQYDPAKYQAEGGTISGGFAEPHRGFEKFTFRPIDWEKEEKNKRILFVGRPDDFPKSVKVLRTINFLDGEPAIKLVEG